jgi:hypothetical protein
MPTIELINRCGELMRHRAALVEAGKGKAPGVMSRAWKEADAAAQAYRLDVAEHHRQEKIKLAALNERLRVHREGRLSRMASAGSN